MPLYAAAPWPRSWYAHGTRVIRVTTINVRGRGGVADSQSINGNNPKTAFGRAKGLRSGPRESWIATKWNWKPAGCGCYVGFCRGDGRVKEDCRKRQQYISRDILYFLFFFLCIYWGRGTIRGAKCADNRAIIFVHPSGGPVSVGRPDEPTIDFRKTTPIRFVTDCRCRVFAMPRRLITWDASTLPYTTRSSYRARACFCRFYEVVRIRSPSSILSSRRRGYRVCRS